MLTTTVTKLIWSMEKKTNEGKDPCDFSHLIIFSKYFSCFILFLWNNIDINQFFEFNCYYVALSRSFYMLLTLVIRHSFSDWRRFLLWSFASEKKLTDPNWCNVKYCWEVSCPTQSYTSCKSIDEKECKHVDAPLLKAMCDIV